MQQPIVIIGIGEIGAVLAQGFLRLGYPVYPITRRMAMPTEAAQIPAPALVIVAVGEADLHPTLAQLPDAWRTRVALLQNELLPPDWEQHGLTDLTVISVWFEKKRGQTVKIVVPSPVYGHNAALLAASLNALDIPHYLVHDHAALLFELVRKNYYILVSNIAGLRVGGTVSTLWAQHPALVAAVAHDVHALQEYLTGTTLNHAELLQAMLVAFAGDPEHPCMGRSAPARLQRALHIADTAGLAVPTLRDIAASRS
ncbi:MAG: hypothetical protein BWK73_14365 [Thiothrix lacustris]|uniref:Ketopantoate reductase N-terminal domain-containing protein n=1 Tax=Thiothrix lacustris TaxID=525917 RepID=A0A1Y1QSI0_9GAMM|nr:MAG: hypothetical protein BWK73_14365 [Thiothrix lacustris]